MITLIRKPDRHGAQIIGFDDSQGFMDFPVLITFDATTSEIHEAPSEVTSHPVEGGEDISDHIQLLPRTIQMEVIVSATPLWEEGLPGRLDDAHQAILKIRRDRKPVRVISTLEDYGDMVLTNYKVNIDSDSGEALAITLEWKQVQIVSPSTVLIPASVIEANYRASAKSADRVGKQTGTEPTKEENAKGQTILRALTR